MAGHIKNIITEGIALKEAEKVLIMLHGRGANAEDIISLSEYLKLQDTHIIAPQATNNEWYPYSFLSPRQQNEPWLSSALQVLKEILIDIIVAGFKSEQVFILGFSQGACLALEFATQNAQPFGGIIAFTGGLIGDVLQDENYRGNFQKTKVFIGNSDRDPHVPVTRSEESKKILEKLGAEVTLKIYTGMAHTVNDDELNWVNEHMFKL
ncbi:MAG: dienelactone hydrolase family protein [Ginsengibacter sp.]